MLLPLLLALSTQAPDTAHIVIVSTTDVQGHATAWNYLTDRPFPGGLARASRVVDSLRQRYPGGVVLVDAGDAIQGDPFAAYYAANPQDPHPVIDVMGAMGYDAATPGNHDFDWGVPFMLRAFRGAAFPYVSANIYTLPADTLAFPAYTVVRRQGVRIGITGLTTPGAMVWDRGYLRGRARIARVDVAANRALRLLAPNADFTVVLMHSGLDGPSSYDTTGVGAENVAATLAQGGIKPDLVVVGHAHGEFADSVIGGVHFVEPSNFAQSLSVVHVTLQRQGGEWRPIRIRGELVPLESVEPSAGLKRRQDPQQDAVRRWVTQPLGSVSAEMLSTTARAEPTAIVNFINDVERRHAGTDLAATPVFDQRSGWKAGEVTVAQVAALYPNENTLVGIRITGQQLKDYLEQSARYFTVDAEGRVGLNADIPGYDYDIVSGAEYAIDLRLPPGDRIRGLTVQGKAVAAADRFTLALGNYRQSGGGNFAMLAGAPVMYDRGENIRDLLMAEIRSRRVVEVADFATANWRIVPDEAARAVRRLFAPTPEPVRAPPPRDTTVLRIFATGDLHGVLSPQVHHWSHQRAVGGMAILKRLMDSLTTLCGCSDLRIDAGDAMQGTLASNLDRGRSMVAAMNQLGINATVVGSHDFDWGLDTLLVRMSEARYPWLLANVTDTASGHRPDWAIPYRVITAGRLHVGVIGYLTPETNRAVRPGNLRAARVEGPAGLAEPLRLLRAQHPDVIVLLAHEGGRCDNTAAMACTGPVVDLARGLDSGSVDLIVAGHLHSPWSTKVNGIPIVQTGSDGGDIAVVDVIKTLVGTREVRVTLVPVYADSIGADSQMSAAVVAFTMTSDSLAGITIATLKTPLPQAGDQYPLGNLVADAQKNALRTDFSLINNGAIRSALPAGPVTYAQLYQVQPLQNELVRVRLSGRVMRSVLEQVLERGSPGAHIAGLRVSYDSTRPAGHRVREVRLPNGHGLDDGANYSLAVDDYLAAGNDGYTMLSSLPVERSGILDFDALVMYLRRLPQPVAPPEEKRFAPNH